MRKIADATLEMASELRVLFVTNLRWEDLSDLGPDGVVNTSQYYTQREADGMIRSLQELGVSVQPFFNELDFIAAVTQKARRTDDKHELVFTTAEGGRGSGRRALIPALCNLLSLPFLNSGAHASSMARQKFHTNAVLRQVGVRVPGTWQFGEGRWLGGIQPPTGSRVILKPTYETMCIGIGDDSVQIVNGDFESFVEDKHRRFGQPVIVQEFITGEEVGVPIAHIGSTYALPPVTFRRASGEPFGPNPRTFEDEHVLDDMSITPFHGPSVLLTVLRDAATTAFEAIEMKGVGRIDLRVDVDGRAWVFDTSECPPPLPGGSYALAMESLGFSYREMLAVWLGICLLEFGLLSGI
jgi:D-alanine-D-alanine ligase